MAEIITDPISDGKALTAGVYTTLHYCQAPQQSATLNVRMVSRSLTDNIAIRLYLAPAAFVDGGSPPAADYIIQPQDLVLGPDGIKVGIFEDSAVVMKPGQKLIAYVDKSLCTAHWHGFAKRQGS